MNPYPVNNCREVNSVPSNTPVRQIPGTGQYVTTPEVSQVAMTSIFPTSCNLPHPNSTANNMHLTQEQQRRLAGQTYPPINVPPQPQPLTLQQQQLRQQQLRQQQIAFNAMHPQQPTPGALNNVVLAPSISQTQAQNQTLNQSAPGWGKR